MSSRDALDLMRFQVEHDRQRTRRFPWLLDVKAQRMRASPLAFLRGSAALFYRALSLDPWLREGVAGDGWIVGDLHLENFGAFRLPSDGAKDAVTFDLNDFDEALRGALRHDLLRLVTSLIVGGREMGADGMRALGMSRVLVDAWRGAVFRDDPTPPTPRPVQRLIARVELRTRKELLDARTELARGQRRFLRGPRYRDLAPELREKVTLAFEEYARRVDPSWCAADQLAVEDVAFRVAGNGSLGNLRVAVLVRGKGGDDGHWVFDMKEQSDPTAAILYGAGEGDPVERVTEALATFLGKRPKFLGAARVDGMRLLVKRLAPQEDKLDLGRVESVDLDDLARYLGALVGRAHRRGLAGALPPAWTDGDRDALVERAIVLAGLHESAWLAFCSLAASAPRPDVA